MVQVARGCASGAPARVLRWLCALSILSLSAPGAPALADGGVTFNDIAEDGGAGITYLRVGTPERQAARAAIEAMETLPNETWRMTRALQFPMKADGTPGVALLDFDDDGDLDIYVTNGPGAPNSLYSNQLEETGVLEFVDVAADARVTATDQDSSGVCFGDIDNDGDLDIVVWNRNEPPSLLRNDLRSENQWIQVGLEGTKSNRAALGAQVTAAYGDRKQTQTVLSQASFYSSNDLRLHFGLGTETKVDLEVRWPSGEKQVFSGVSAGRVVQIREGRDLEATQAAPAAPSPVDKGSAVR